MEFIPLAEWLPDPADFPSLDAALRSVIFEMLYKSSELSKNAAGFVQIGFDRNGLLRLVQLSPHRARGHPAI